MDIDKNKKYVMRYKTPAPDVNDAVFSQNHTEDVLDGWEKWSLPIGNGKIGANIFGRTGTERIQLTENSFANPMYSATCGAGLNNLCEVILDFGHKDVTDYERGLDLNNAVAYTRYSYKDCEFSREYLASYPDSVIAVKLDCSKKCAMNFNVSAQSPFTGDYCVAPFDGMAKSSETTVTDNIITVRAKLHYYSVLAEVQIAVLTDGEINQDENKISVSGATQALLIIAVATNYQLESSVFSEPDPQKKLKTQEYPHKKVSDILNSAAEKGFEVLKETHIADYRQLFGRVSLDIADEDKESTTDYLLEQYRNGIRSAYLEELLFVYGRYLLISSSRQGGLPANLQGIWNRYSDSPWTSGYWHNINVQMNYWPSCVCGLSNLFLTYVDYFKAYLPSAQNKADEYILKYFPDKFDGQGNNGWTIGTGAWPYEIYGLNTEDHSGPGTAAIIATLFWDYYDFTRDDKALESTVYPALYGASLFLSKIMIKEKDEWLVKYSASPEQWKDGKCYRTTGCTFDQQTAYELFRDTIAAAELLGKQEDPLIYDIREKLTGINPYPIGKSGQIKEYREEKFYGEIGEEYHRHISHLFGIYPGIYADRHNKLLNEAVKKTLLLRGDRTTGWAMVHRMCVWARTGDAAKTDEILNQYIKMCIFPNLWNSCMPFFQIDGNFGYCAAVAEMLIQSNGGEIDLLPALPLNWQNGKYSGLLARGGFKVDLSWKNGKPESISVFSLAGEKIKLICSKFTPFSVRCGDNSIDYSLENGYLEFNTNAGQEYAISVGI